MIPTLLTVLILCTNANWHELERCTAPVASFESQGEAFTGILESGVTFTIKPILSDPSVKLHRFEMEKAYWYVSDKGKIDAESDLQALSIYMTL